MELTTYLIIFATIELVVDFSGFQSGMPIISRFIAKHPHLSHPLQCSLCSTFWFTLAAVLFLDIPIWTLLLPFLTSPLQQVVMLFYNWFAWLISKLTP